MAKKSGPRARPITVSELIARSETDGAFPKASDDEAPTRRRTVGASGMPSHAPAAPAKTKSDEPAVGPEANAVTGIIPIVRDDDEYDSDVVDTDGFTPLESDDPVGFDLPPVEYRTVPIAPVIASAAAVAAVEPDPDVTTTAQLKAIVDGDAGVGDAGVAADDFDDSDFDDADYDDLDDADLDDAEADVDDDEVEEVAAEVLSANKPNKRALRDRARKVKAAKNKAAKDKSAADKAADKADHEPSAVMAWLALVAEIVVGLAIGAGLFWGFTELWKRYVYLALILAVVVIFAIVTFAHILRKRDLPTTLLALGVGMLVTIGPLVLLAA